MDQVPSVCLASSSCEGLIKYFSWHGVGKDVHCPESFGEWMERCCRCFCGSFTTGLVLVQLVRNDVHGILKRVRLSHIATQPNAITPFSRIPASAALTRKVSGGYHCVCSTEQLVT